MPFWFNQSRNNNQNMQYPQGRNNYQNAYYNNRNQNQMNFGMMNPMGVNMQYPNQQLANRQMMPQMGMRQNNQMLGGANRQQGNNMPQQGFGMQQGNNMPQQGFGMQQGNNMPQQGFGMQQGNNMPQQGFGMQQGNNMPQQGFGMPQGNHMQANQGINTANAPLPDGVRIEPLDEKMLANIKGTMGERSNSIPIEGKREKNTNLIEQKMEEFLQNEKNSAEFYTHLSEKAPNDRYRIYLNEIADDCKKSYHVYNQMYKLQKGEDYISQEQEVEKNINFNEGIRWAIEEESRAVRELGVFYESLEDDKIAKKINALMLKKVGNLSYMHVIMSH